MTCRSGKQPFDSPAEAAAAMKKLLERHGNKRRSSEGKTHVYVCPFCKKRHLGHAAREHQ